MSAVPLLLLLAGLPRTWCSCAPECEVRYFVDPARGDDGGTGERSRPFATVAKCVSMASRRSSGAGEQGRTRCLLGAGRYKELVEVRDVHGLSIEPGTDGPVVFDGTEAVEGLAWRTSNGVSSAMIPAGPTQRPFIIVGGDAIQCAAQAAGAAVLESLGFCFHWHVAEGWPTLFKREQAEAFYSGAGAAEPPATPFWYEVTSATLFVHTASYPGGFPEVRRVRADAGIVFTKGTQLNPYAKDVTIRNLNFYGAVLDTQTDGWASNAYISDITVSGNRFLYHPSKVQLVTTVRMGRGAGKYVEFANNVLEFGMGSLFYKSTEALVEGNYFAFNTLDESIVQGSFDFAIHSLGIRDTIRNNTALYLGDNGGIFAWSAGFTIENNIVLGHNAGHTWHDTACVHALTGAQTGLVVRGNWFLGIAPTIKSVRLDTAQTTTFEQMGRGTVVSRNVAFGLDTLTIKGDEHSITHNTGDELNIVAGWGAIDSMNGNTTTAWNLMDAILSRSSEGGQMPGFFHDNVEGSAACAYLRRCNLDALGTGLVRDLSVFDFRPSSSTTRAGALAHDDPKTTPGAPVPEVPFPGPGATSAVQRGPREPQLPPSGEPSGPVRRSWLEALPFVAFAALVLASWAPTTES